MAKKKILLLSDDIRLHSGIGTMARELVMGTLHKYDWIQMGGAIRHPNAGQGWQDMSSLPETIKESGIENGYLKILPVDGYGNSDILRQVIKEEQPDLILHFTDPRFWGWLYDIAHELRQHTPLAYYNIWDDLPFPHWNEPFYESCDLLMAISKQTYNINKHVCQNKPRTDFDLKYVQHGVDKEKYKHLEETDANMIGMRNELLGANEYDFIAFFNSRNIRRKGCSDLIQAFGEFVKSLDEDKRNRCLLLMHTDVVDEHGTDLSRLSEKLYPEIKILFSTSKLPYEKLNIMYNIADVTCNPSSAEGFGLSHMESLMACTPTIATVCGGLQDQMGFKVDGKELSFDDFTSEIASNSTGKISKDHGEWVYPLWPNHSLQGSPPTPYIYDSRPEIKDIIKGLEYWYNQSRDERKSKGRKGREWAIENGFDKNGMCNAAINSFEDLFENWSKLEKFELIDLNKKKLIYPTGVL